MISVEGKSPKLKFAQVLFDHIITLYPVCVLVFCFVLVWVGVVLSGEKNKTFIIRFRANVVVAFRIGRD